MELRRPKAPGNVPRSQGSFTGKPQQRPQWFLDWIDNLPRFVELACGNKVDLKWNGQLTLTGIEDANRGIVLTNCERCQQFCTVTRKIDLLEYKGIATAATPDTPLF